MVAIGFWLGVCRAAFARAAITRAIHSTPVVAGGVQIPPIDAPGGGKRRHHHACRDEQDFPGRQPELAGNRRGPTREALPADALQVSREVFRDREDDRQSRFAHASQQTIAATEGVRGKVAGDIPAAIAQGV